MGSSRFVALVCLCIVSCSLGQTEKKNRRRAGHCEPLESTLCCDAGYNTTYISDDKDRGYSKVEYYGFKTLLQELCPEYFIKFVFGVYFPKCSSARPSPMFPCRSFCEKARSECEAAMSVIGLEWPKKFSCRRFRKNGKCISEETDRVETTSELPANTSLPIAGSCEAITIPYCSNLGYTLTYIPPYLSKIIYESEAIQQLQPFIQDDCSPHLTTFFCSVVAPECTDTQQAIKACRSLCEVVRDSCSSTLESRYRFDWSFTCEDFPDSNCRGISTHTTREEVCEPVNVAMCSGLEYRTHFPNSRFETQSSSGAMLGTFAPIIQSDCYEHLQEFLCAAFIPECTEAQVEILPCRSGCEAAKEACYPLLQTFGFQWPDTLSCDNFPTDSCKEFPGIVEPALTTSCQSMTIPVCETLGYSPSFFPSAVAATHDEVAGMINRFVPLMRVKCSDVLQEFICLAYAPYCDETGQPRLPCRSLCESARDGCNSLMTKFGFPWPDELTCSNFPVTNCKTLGTHETSEPEPEPELSTLAHSNLQSTTPAVTPTIQSVVQMQLVRRHLTAVNEAFGLLEEDVEGLISSKADSESRAILAVLDGLRYSVSGLRGSLDAISAFLEVFAE